MNSLVVVFYFFRLTSAGGAERMIIRLANALVERGFSVGLVSWDDADSRAFYPIDQRVRWHRLGIQSGFVDKIRRTRCLVRQLRVDQAQVLVGFVMSGDKVVYAAAKLAGVKLIVAERNAPSMYHLRYGWFQRWTSFFLLHLADHILVQMTQHAKGYPASLDSRISAIANPVSITKHKAHPQQPNAKGRFMLLAIARLDPIQKGLGTLISAFARIAAKHSDWDLQIIGNGPQESVLRNLVDETGLSERVRIEPPVENIFGEYVKAHLFVMPSLWEGFPNALAEAMSHQLPAVGFEQASGVAELIKKGGGWLAEGLDDEISLAKTLSKAMSATAERQARGIEAAQGMVEFDPKRQFDKWAELLTILTRN